MARIPNFVATVTAPLLLIGVAAMPACGRASSPQQNVGATGNADRVEYDEGLRAYQNGDYATALARLEPLAAKGHGDAAFVCGLMYQHGRGVKLDGAAAARFYTLGARSNHDRCQNNLGVLFRDGVGVEKNPATAAEWFRKAALSNNDDAQLSLGALFVNGDGVARDYAEAAAWYTIAGEHGNKAASANLEQLRPHMDPDQLAAIGPRADELKSMIASAAAKASGPIVQSGGGSDLPAALPPVETAATTSAPSAAPPGVSSGPRFDWRNVASPSPTGMVMVAAPLKEEAANTGIDLLRLAAQALATRAGAKPMLLGAMTDATGTLAQSPFEMNVPGAGLKRGILMARAPGAPGGAAVAAVYDDASSFAANAGALLQAVAKELPAPGTAQVAPPTPVVWQTVPLPDGTGTLRVPQGWVITGAYQGIVDANGPEGAVSLGAFFQVFTPEAAAQYFARPSLVAPYNDPESAARSVLAQMGQIAQQTGQVWVELGRVREKSPVEWPGGQAVMTDVDFDIVGNTNGQMVRNSRRGLVLWGIAPVNNEQFLFYQSAVSSPPEQFARNLPVLMEIWKGWRVSDATLRGRLDAAAKSLNEANRILTETNANRQDAMERANAAWDHYIRGDWPVEDTREGRRYIGDNNTLKDTVEFLNREEGQERWRIVPYAELNR